MPTLEITVKAVSDAAEVFMKAWNRGDLEGACQIYAPDASFIADGKYTQGRDAILERYRASYPDHTTMGTLKLELREFRYSGTDTPDGPGMASAIFEWALTVGEKVHCGFTLETYAFSLEDDRLYLLQDATV